MAVEDNGFLEDPDIELEDLNKTSATKTNIVLYGRNFIKLTEHLIRMKDYIRYLASIIDIDSLLASVVLALQESKTIINILPTLVIGTPELQTVSGIQYSLLRTDEYSVEITNITNPEWAVDAIMAQVKTVSGMFVYPTIETISSKIIIRFNDGFSKQYNIVLL